MSDEQRLKLLQLAAQLGLSSMYDASRDTYTGWSAKVLAFAQAVMEENK